MKTKRRFIVLGGAGTIGRTVVRDLFESHPDNRILIADYKKEAAESLTDSFKDKRVTAKFVDATNLRSLISVMKKQTAVINCTQHNFNLMVMRAALRTGVHYLDLGGLFSWTRKQLKLNEKFQNAGLIAVIGMGCAPGITNVLAAYAAGKLDKINSIKIRVGSKDFTSQSGKLIFSYSAQTIIEELTLKPWLFENREFRQLIPQSGWELTNLPKPVGKVWTLWTRHSEIATLPVSFWDKGLTYCDFKVSFEREFVKEVMKRLESGWTIKQFNDLVTPKKHPDDYEISRVTVDNIIVDCHAKAKSEWHAGAGDVDTACPPSIVAQMIADGTIYRPGVMPPEIAVPVQPFFRELEKRGMKIKTTRL